MAGTSRQALQIIPAEQPSRPKNGFIIHRRAWFSCLLALFFLSACSGLEKNEQSQLTSLKTFPSGGNLGQTLVARYDGLQAVAVYLSSEGPETQAITLQVREKPGMSEALRSAELNPEKSLSGGFYRFDFPPITDSNGKYLYLEFKLDGAQAVQFGTAPAQSYLNGSLYENSLPVEAQLSFQLSYHPGFALLGLGKEIFTWAYGIFLAFLLFTVPGWATASLLLKGWPSLSWMEKAALGTSLSLALYPLLLLWTGLLGIHLGSLLAWLPVLTGLALILWNNRLSIRSPGLLANQLKSLWSSNSWARLCLGCLVVLLFATRLWAVRSLDAPMWGDSYQHSVITQLILDHGGLFESWQPYSELVSFTYHFGFHSLAAAFHWASGLPSHLSVLWTGQILNVLAVLCLYPLALRMNRNPWSGIAAVLAAGLLTSIPMFYVNWGRYTQLAGMVILPALAWVSWDAGKQDQRDWSRLIFTALLLAGLGLTHYRVLILAAGWFLTLILANSISGSLKRTVVYVLFAGLLALVLSAPWLARIISSDFLDWIATLFPSSINPAVSARPPENPLAYLPRYSWFLLPVLVGWGLWRRNRGSALAGLWWLILCWLANLKMFRLPFTGLDMFTIQISGYLFFALFIGETAGWLADQVNHSREIERPHSRPRLAQRWVAGLLLCAGMLSTLWFARQRLWDVRPDLYGLVTRPDTHAYTWIQENTSFDSKFLVNSFFAFNNSVIVGSDGGWWLPLLAHRMTTTPPINYDFEAGPTVDFQQTTNLLVREIEQKGLDDPAVLQMLQDRGIGYVYVGQKQGSVNSPGALIDIEQLNNSQNYRQIYHQDRVWIFQLTAD